MAVENLSYIRDKINLRTYMSVNIILPSGFIMSGYNTSSDDVEVIKKYIYIVFV